MTVDTSEAQQNITIYKGEATALATNLTVAAESYIRNRTIMSQATAYQTVSTLTGQTASDTLMDYIYFTNLLNTKNATVLVGVDRAILTMSGKGY
jgi:hypothetical protein